MLGMEPLLVYLISFTFHGRDQPFWLGMPRNDVALHWTPHLTSDQQRDGGSLGYSVTCGPSAAATVRRPRVGTGNWSRL